MDRRGAKYWRKTSVQILFLLNSRRFCYLAAVCICFSVLAFPISTVEARDWLKWRELPPLPNELGVAGPFAGVDNDALIVAGGANFPRPVWENDKQWVDQIHVLVKQQGEYVWKDGGRLPRPIAYGASVSTPNGVLCIGGNDAEHVYRDVFLLRWDGTKVTTTPCPALPAPCCYCQAAIIGTTAYVACGQQELGLESATNTLWALDLTKLSDTVPQDWKLLPPLPGPTRAFALVAAQHDGFRDSLYVIGGRRSEDGATQFLRDVWRYEPVANEWKQRRDAPRIIMAGEAIGMGQSHILILGGADENNFDNSDELKDQHPGFPREAFSYHTITDSWSSAGEIPENLVTTTAVRWDGAIILPSGEIRPRVRSPHIWRITPIASDKSFGTLNYVVLFAYLLAMVGVGVYFARMNKNTDDFFRGGMRIPWWAAGCSIFATMLSSLTFTGIPSKAYAQDWVYAIGNLTIPLVAIVAVYVALPFYRRIDATSAYEYLEMRFGRPVRVFASASFALFHVFRMAVVMSLTGLALAVATPLSPAQSVLLMGVLSILYCTMGGIEAVIWTDTIQTVVLLGGAMLAIGLLVSGVDGGVSGFLSVAASDSKFNLANLHWDATDAQTAFWVIIVGAIAQNLSSYTADQAVVQRYMTTPNETLAARSIWTNAVLAVPATLLFFGIGTALHAFYQSHPEKLDPTITTDQIFPLFIAREIPAGLAGLIVAGIFAAAQSTVSTSMNSTATTIVTDFLKPLNCCRTEHGYLNAARLCTLLIGIAGTCLGLVFANPEIRSLFDAFIIVIGLFMGVLGGLFLLGALTRRANQFGAMTGALVGAGVMFCLWKYSTLNGYLYTACGITVCFVVGYVASLVTPQSGRDLTGLTIFDARRSELKNQHSET
ncbi:sodium/solute symporter [Blastopirellula sp. J2-11]|uniref:sodium:solute symporter family transporter n=1 Tax=Blastopirellula sp. J2-11 TaxID=2943192 RepID=UPI0021C7A827|nr:sodium/solute symporter [Blastopirellula sp. J2-11]UUO05126.1 sodium/solute symporter [Blastopirellula sp. J2-11]